MTCKGIRESDLFAKLDEYLIARIARNLREDNEERIDTYPYLRDLAMLARTCRRMHTIVGALLSREMAAMDGLRGISCELGADHLYYVNKRGSLHRYNGPALQYGSNLRQWCIDGRPHRVGGPAIIYVDGSCEWYLYGKLHRENGPAIERANGDREWYRNGELHREGGPAIKSANGDRKWYRNGELHRENGPAIEYADGTRVWCYNGQVHRQIGPAVIRADGTYKWYWYGTHFKTKYRIGGYALNRVREFFAQIFRGPFGRD